uniref:Putative ribonuclease H-like domain-containing protein n=1 Tax=Tanacetum cinerariifolium TaxID=118510 RepID=A0A699JJH5_TANCI|nr:putative ribonuclease H-like domain-containing protein [Tanacetum cinerariifolium]
MEVLIQTCLMPLTIKTQSDSLKFVHELKQEMNVDLKYVESLEKEIDELESEKAEFSDMYDAILQDCVSKDVMCSYLQSLSDLDALAELYLHKNIAISELKKLIEKEKGKSVDTKFDRPSVVRQPNAQRIPKPSVLGKPTPFSDSLERRYFPKTKSVLKANVSEGMYRIDNKTAHTRVPQLPQTVRNTNLRVSTSIEVNHKPTVSRLQLKSNQSRDKVVPNTSQVKVKKTQVEVHPRIPSVSNKMKSVTVCKDSLTSRTLNANAVCATCNKCLVDSNHFACVTKMLNDEHARTKKPTVVPNSTRKPNSQMNKSVATPHKKKIVQLILFIVDSGCTKHMTANLKLLCNFVEKFLGTVRFGDDQFAPILGYGDLVQGNVTINRVYYVEGLNHKLFSVGQFCDAELEVACINWKKYILVIVDDYSRYTWTLFLRSKDETPEVLKDFFTMIQRNLQAPVIIVRTDRGIEFLNKTLNAFFKEEGIEHQTSTAQTPEQNGVVKRRNRTLVEAARTMLSASQLPLFF